MKKRELSDDIIESLEATPEEIPKLLEKFSIGECWEKSFIYKNLIDTSPIMVYIERLKRGGLDIGRGDAKFGYRLPIPQKGEYVRYLRIFRRS